MDISIVIPCKDDKRVVECVRSIDVPAEVVIVFNGSQAHFIDWVQSQLDNTQIVYEVLEEANLAWALETGIWSAKHDIVLLMDSDCTFEMGSICQFWVAIEKGNPTQEVYKGSIAFKSGKGFISSVIAKSRQHHTGETLCAYKPPLALSKKIAPSIGGYFFDKRLIWREDADLDHRIREANIKIIWVRKGKIHHDAMDLRTDLRSTFRYGIGGAIAGSLGITLTDVPRSVLSTLQSQGIAPALYMLFRNRIYDLGYLYTKLKYLLKPYVS